MAAAIMTGRIIAISAMRTIISMREIFVGRMAITTGIGAMAISCRASSSDRNTG
jgi:hypothetical protein